MGVLPLSFPLPIPKLMNARLCIVKRKEKGEREREREKKDLRR